MLGKLVFKKPNIVFVVCKAFLKKTTYLVFSHSDLQMIAARPSDSTLGETLHSAALNTAVCVPVHGRSPPKRGRRWAGSKPLPCQCLDKVLLDSILLIYHSLNFYLDCINHKQ